MFFITFKNNGICTLLSVPNYTLAALVVKIDPSGEPWTVQRPPEGPPGGREAFPEAPGEKSAAFAQHPLATR